VPVALTSADYSSQDGTEPVEQSGLVVTQRTGDSVTPVAVAGTAEDTDHKDASEGQMK
jgi:hypothetical protein